MDVHSGKVYVPTTETEFYILQCPRELNHGYEKKYDWFKKKLRI